jgi:hypothetical protein
MTRLSVLRRALSWCLVAVVVACAAVVVRDFSAYVGAYPYLAADDGLANVSYSLATVDRYGLLTSPLQGPNDAPRHDGFFNYGPWYFYAGAALTWLFGYSFEMLRAIHLGSILLLVAAAFWWFRDGKEHAAAALFGIAILQCFQISHWPMVRPDVMVSVFAVGLVLFSGLAFRSGSGWQWFAAGFAAASGAFTHLIAWSLVPACAALFSLGEWLRHRQGLGKPGQWIRNLGFVAAGGLAGTLAFYASFDFRIGDHLALLGAYQSWLGTTDGAGNPYAKALMEHWRYAYGYLSEFRRGVIAAILAAGWLLPALTVWLRPRAAVPVASVLAPPALVWGLYLASLANYPNYHTGYAILSQVMAFWTGAALFQAALLLLDDGNGAWGDRARIAVALAAIAWGGNFAYRVGTEQSDKAISARQWVNIDAYVDEVLVSIPAGARAWGTITYGNETPDRLQLVQFGEAFRLVERAPPARRDELAPDYLLWGYSENRDSLMAALAGQESLMHSLERLFPRYRYRLVKIVRAPPYGAARIFQRTTVGPGGHAPDCRPDRAGVFSCVPTVGFYHPETRQWIRAAGDAMPASAVPVPPQEFRVGYAGSVAPSRADRSVSLDLPPGDYLVGVRVSTAAGEKSVRAMIATSPDQATQTIGELGARFDSMTYTSVDREVFLAHRHTGGALVVSQIDRSKGAALGQVVAFPAHALRDFRVERRERSFVPLPAPHSWIAESGTGVVASREGEAFRVQGDDTRYGYQLLSPPIAIGPNRNAVVRLDFTVERGEVCTGILNESKTKWILVAAERKNELHFNSGSAASVRVAFANCNYSAQPPARSLFTLRNAAYSADESENVLYTDQLMRGR